MFTEVCDHIQKPPLRIHDFSTVTARRMRAVHTISIVMQEQGVYRSPQGTIADTPGELTSWKCEMWEVPPHHAHISARQWMDHGGAAPPHSGGVGGANFACYRGIRDCDRTAPELLGVSSGRTRQGMLQKRRRIRRRRDTTPMPQHSSPFVASPHPIPSPPAAGGRALLPCRCGPGSPESVAHPPNRTSAPP